MNNPRYEIVSINGYEDVIASSLDEYACHLLSFSLCRFIASQLANDYFPERQEINV